jgi:magnesium transporter
VLLKLINRFIQHFYGHLKAINAIAGEIEQRINQSMENRSLLQMFALEKSLTYYLSAISSNGKTIERLKLNAHNPETFGFAQEHEEIVDDLSIENSQCYEQANIHASIFAGLMDARASIVSNNLNLLMRKLTMLMIALMWPPLVCAFLSMNVLLPVRIDSLIPFLAVTVLALGPVLGVGGILWWRRRRDRLRSPSAR